MKSPFAKPLEAFLQQTPLPILTLHHGRIACLNPAAETLYGIPSIDAEGLSYEIFSGNPLPQPSPQLQTHPRKTDAQPLHLEVHHHPDSEGQTDYLLLINRTQERRLEQQLLDTQRLECLGALFSGIAHDLNNILTPIMMSAAMLNEPALEEAERAEYVESIEQSALRGVNLLRQVLSFSRGVAGESVPVRLGPIIHEIVEITRRTFPRVITIETSIAHELWQVLGEPTRLHQVLLNLTINARDAMEHGGKLQIEAINRELTRDNPLAEGKPGPYVQITIRDTGCGIAPEHREAIFQPFFTTKAPGKGTGLGLPTVLGIVKGYGGRLDLESQLGEGTTLRIVLPAIADTVTLAETKSKMKGEEGSILVVDDEPGIRKMIRAVLIRNGYKVILASDGMEAMAEYLREPSAIRLILADLVMPAMDGIVLSRAIRRLDPDAVIVATSGFESDQRMEELASLGITHYLPKPFQGRDLIEIIETALKR